MATNAMLSTEDITRIMEMQKGFDAMSASVGIVEKKYANLKGAIKGNAFVKAGIQIKAWGNNIKNSIDIMSDWRNMSDKDREEKKKGMTVFQKLLVPMMAYTTLGSNMNKIMGKHNNILTRMITRVLSLFAILGLIIFVFAAVSIAIDGANSPLVEMTEDIPILEGTVQGLILVFAGEDGEGGLTGAVNLATASMVAFLVVAAVFGSTMGAIVATVMLVVGTVNLVMNATDDVVTSGLAAIAVALIVISGFLFFLGGATAVAMAPLILFAGVFFAVGAMIWAVVTGKAPVWLAFVAAFLLSLLLFFGGFIAAATILPFAALALVTILLFAWIYKNWEGVKKWGGLILGGLVKFVMAIVLLPFLLSAKVVEGIIAIGKAIFGFFALSKEKKAQFIANLGMSLVRAWTNLKKKAKDAVKWIAGIPNRSWQETVRGLARVAVNLAKWYNKNIAGFLKFTVPKWIPGIGGDTVNIPPKIPIPALAEGGIVKSATLALIGEKGPEAVVPLGKGGHGLGNTFNIRIDVSGVTDRSDKRQLAMQISDEIQKEMRRWGRGSTRRSI